jgi:hypothetical protein
VHAQHARLDAELRHQLLGDLNHRPQEPAGRNEGQVRPVSDGDGLPELEGGRARMNRGLAGSAEAEVAGPLFVDDRPRQEFRLDRVPGGDDEHPRQGTHDRQVLGGVVRHAERAVGQPSADCHHLHVRVVVADVVPDLLEAAEGREIRDRVRKDDLTAQREAGGDPRHVLLGDPRVDEAAGKARGERLHYPKPEIANDEHHTLVPFGELHERAEEGCPHNARSSSASARRSSSSSGAR